MLSLLTASCASFTHLLTTSLFNFARCYTNSVKHTNQNSSKKLQICIVDKVQIQICIVEKVQMCIVEKVQICIVENYRQSELTIYRPRQDSERESKFPAEGPDALYWYLVAGAACGVDGPAGNATAGPRILNSTGACP